MCQKLYFSAFHYEDRSCTVPIKVPKQKQIFAKWQVEIGPCKIFLLYPHKNAPFLTITLSVPPPPHLNTEYVI